jgi:hypothetical protein
MAHLLIHGAHVAKHGGIFTLGGFILGAVAAAPWVQVEHTTSYQYVLDGQTYTGHLTTTTYENVFGLPWEEAIGFMVFLGAVLALVGLLVGRAVVKLGWLSEGDLHAE